MSLVARQIPALYNGVSQQPATTRLASQAEEQVNGWSSVVDGLKKRPPTEHVAKLTASDLGGAYTHLINRDSTERYVVCLLDRQIKVFDLNGVEKTVNVPGRAGWSNNQSYPDVGVTVSPTTPNGFLYRVTDNGTSGGTEPTWPTTLGSTVVDGTVTWQCVPDYLKVDDPLTEFSAVTVADFTFIVNKSVYTAMAPVGDDEYTPTSTMFSITETMKKRQVKALLQQQSQQDAAVRAQYGANPSGGIFRGTVQTLQEIPESPAPANGDIWEIRGTSESNFATYYVRRNGSVWDETVAPNLPNRILECTMPHALVRLADGTFELQTFSWAPRRVGDETTNPNPSFISRQIREIFFYQNRLGFCVDENVTFSRAGDFGNFYRLTVVDLLADETVDIAAATTQVTKINYAVPFNNALMLFSDQVQFVMSHQGALTPGTVSMDVATRYVMTPNVRPLALGSDVYFASEGSTHSRVYEYYVRDDANNTEASDITAHVPKFIPKNVRALFGSPDHDLLCVASSDEPSRLYTYKFYWTSEQDKAQSAWSYWQFPSSIEVLGGGVIGSYLYLVIKRPDGTYLEKANLDGGAVAPGLTHEVYLDRRVETTGVYLEGQGVTEWSIPYAVPAANKPSFRLVIGGGESNEGAVVSVDPNDYSWTDDQTIQIAGPRPGAAIGGLAYEFRYQFSEQFMKNAADVPVASGRLQLRTWTVHFTDTAYFQTEVSPYGTDPDIEEVVPNKFASFEGKTIGESSLVTGQPVFGEGTYAFQIYGNADVATVSLVNDSPYGCNFTAAEWEAFYQNRISRLV